MNHLDELENKSNYIIREAFHRFDNMALLWSIGKDSTTLLWLTRKAFLGQIPFPCVHIDTTYKFPEMYRFRQEYAEKWGLNLLVHINHEAIEKGVSYDTHDAFTCCTELKTNGLKQAIAKHNYDALLVGIRRDEHGIRAKERVFSPRDQNFQWNYEDPPAELWDQYMSREEEDQHSRVHPLLGWTEVDIWRYIQRENIPTSELYFAKDGKRYRSLGCMPITKPVDSDADTIEKIIAEIETSDETERSGRAQDKEDADTMQKLRALGYM